MGETIKAISLSCCVFLLVVTCFAIPIAMIVIGAKYKDDCPVEHKIPVWLIVSGTVAFFQGTFTPAFRSEGESERSPGRSAFQALGLIVNIFQLVWLVIGSYWVYSNYEPSYNEDNDDYCHKTVFLFTFWILNITYIGLGLAVLLAAASFLFTWGATRRVVANTPSL